MQPELLIHKTITTFFPGKLRMFYNATAQLNVFRLKVSFSICPLSQRQFPSCFAVPSSVPYHLQNLFWRFFLFSHSDWQISCRFFWRLKNPGWQDSRFHFAWNHFSSINETCKKKEAKCQKSGFGQILGHNIFFFLKSRERMSFVPFHSEDRKRGLFFSVSEQCAKPPINPFVNRERSFFLFSVSRLSGIGGRGENTSVRENQCLCWP